MLLLHFSDKRETSNKTSLVQQHLLLTMTSKFTLIMSIVKLSKRTQNILKNFATINKSIVIDKGSTLRTLSVNKNIFASADITEAFPQQVAIYDLGVFLSFSHSLKIQSSTSHIVKNSSLQMSRLSQRVRSTTRPNSNS